MAQMQRITPFLWFADEAEEAAKYYTGIFKNSKIVGTSKYGEAGKETHKRPPGSVMVVEFEIEGQRFSALNGGPLFKFNESVSFVINCGNQEEIDYYWNKLTPGGDPKAQVCGWLKDKFGLSWQVVPTVLDDMLRDSDTTKAGRVMEAMMKMKKVDIADLHRAYAGEVPAGASR